jgi:hypothetical protein
VADSGMLPPARRPEMRPRGERRFGTSGREATHGGFGVLNDRERKTIRDSQRQFIPRARTWPRSFDQDQALGRDPCDRADVRRQCERPSPALRPPGRAVQERRGMRPTRVRMEHAFVPEDPLKCYAPAILRSCWLDSRGPRRWVHAAIEPVEVRPDPGAGLVSSVAP